MTSKDKRIFPKYLALIWATSKLAPQKDILIYDFEEVPKIFNSYVDPVLIDLHSGKRFSTLDEFINAENQLP